MNGTTTVNGIMVTSVSTGSVYNYSPNNTVCGGGNLGPYGLAVGTGGVWSLNLTFAQPVNDVVFIVRLAGDFIGSENYTFTSNGGNVTIPFNNSCGSTIIGNTIIGGTAQHLGEETFVIHSPNAHTQLTIDSPGGHAGSVIGICSTSIVLGTNDVKNNIESNMLAIYPNPIKNTMTISSKETLKSYKIIDGSGKLILSSSLKGNKQEINLSSVQSGSYLISIETDKQIVSKKLIKE
ncbi:T9SS type A sorting domain-containing protein [Chryseobacterium potabilaquae]|uniref:Secretion system C-terminal sorting domain-containing protein n=1 Tax=Chryseobacterium potabilaquae TaxID=2675057 RepID=A0A6N4XD47_9FLAO|nr:T9SS type A sorting domain-containing protein [Chryseobacterium potabilaquae]CAA7197623.1 hypothetical protein CHRY9293_03696 [Chryseobacterium potabilaquae]